MRTFLDTMGKIHTRSARTGAIVGLIQAIVFQS